jgi:hypothetical protein
MAAWRDRRSGLGLALMSRRFPPPWSVEETDACFIVRDGNGQALAYASTLSRSRGDESRVGQCR